MLLGFYATLSYIVWPCVPLCHRPASWLAVGLATRVCVSSGDVCGTAADLMSLGSLLVSNLGAITRLWKVGCEVLARRSPQTARAGMSRGGRRGRGLTVTGSAIRMVSACVDDVHNARRSRSGLTSGEVAQNPWWKVQ